MSAPDVRLTRDESIQAERLAQGLRLSDDTQQQTAARVAFLAELERLCRQHNKRLPLAVLRHLYRAPRPSESVRFQAAQEHTS